MISKKHYESIFLILWNLYSHLKAGIHIELSMKIIEELLSNKRYKKSISIIGKEIQGGKSLYYAFYNEKELYPNLMVDMIKIGEESGNLENVLLKLCNHYKKVTKVRKKIKSILIYPSFLLTMIFAAIILFLTFILPTFGKLYESLNVNGDGFTEKLLFLSRDIEKNRAFWIVLLICIIAIQIVGAILIFKVIWYRNKIPKIKILNKYYELNLIYILNLIVSSGISFYSSFSILEKTLSSRVLKGYIGKINNTVNRGLPISYGLSEIKEISPLTTTFILSGEHSGALQENLEILTEILETNFNNNIDKLVGYLQPIVMLILGAIVGGMVLMVFIPMYSYMSYV